MTLPSSFDRLVEQLSNELNNLDLELYQTIELVRKKLSYSR